MKTISEIEKELREAKEVQKLNELKIELESLKLIYEGKAFGTHTFERNNKQSYNEAVFYERFWIKDSSILALRWDIHISKQGKNYSFSQDYLSFNRSKQEIVFKESSNYGATKEMTVSKFMQLWTQGELVCDKLFDVYSKVIDEPAFDLLRIGTSNDEKKLTAALKHLKLNIIDVTKFPEVFRTLQYCNLPFFQEQRYLPRVYAKQILEYQIKLWKEEKNQSWRSYDDRYDKWIKIIEDFIKQNNLV